MGDWFGDRLVGELNGELQERYASERMRVAMKLVDERISVTTDVPAPAAAYRDLKTPAAAVNRFFKKNVGGAPCSAGPA